MIKPIVHRAAAGIVALTALALLGGCASSLKTAAPQSVQVKNTPMTFGGTFDPRRNDLILTVNGDPVLKGGFPPYTPTLTLNSEHRGTPVRAECYFASIINSKGGFVGRIVAQQVQSAQGKAGDECKIFVNGSQATSLYF